MGRIVRNGIGYGGSTGYTKTEMDSKLAEKADASDLAAVNSTGDIYIGSQLVRKVLTQAEYDALETKDPKVEYLVPEETETEGE